jgi:hypothetical protein
MHLVKELSDKLIFIPKKNNKMGARTFASERRQLITHFEAQKQKIFK